MSNGFKFAVKNSDIRVTAKRRWKNGRLLILLQKVRDPHLSCSIFRRIRSDQKMESCCYIWAGVTQTPLSNLDRIRKRLCGLVDDQLISTQNPVPTYNIVICDSALSLFCGKCSDELHFLVSAIQTFTSKTRHTMYTGANHSHSLRILLVKRKGSSSSFF